MTDDELRDLVKEATAASHRCVTAAETILESAHLLMDLISKTQAEAAKMIAAQLKRSEKVREDLKEMRGGDPLLPGGKVRTPDGQVVETPVRRGRAPSHAPGRRD
jgi:hypothetical protein